MKNLPRYIFWIAALSIAAFALSSTSYAQSRMCGKRAKMIKVLIEKYKETPRALGLSSAKMAMEIFASEKGTWTVMMTLANGTTCIMAAGHSWQQAPVALKGTQS